MDESTQLIMALRTFRTALGDEAYKYINLDAVFRNKILMEQLRASIEHSISCDYLPGFRFPNLGRFTWHLKHEQFYHRYLFGDRTPPKHFVDHWIRRFLLPNHFHYLSEIAIAFQAGAKRSRITAKHIDQPISRILWLKTMSEWLSLEDIDRGYERDPKHAKSWGSLYSGSPERTYIQWAGKAEQYRAGRCHANPPNHWAITSVIYRGGQLELAADIDQSCSMLDTGYLEIWKWLSDGDAPSPKKKQLSFMIPAAPDSWDAPDRHQKP